MFGRLHLGCSEQPGGQPAAQCDISGGLSQQARVSSFRLAGEPPRARGMKQSNRFREQTKGKDGKDPCKLQIQVYDFCRRQPRLRARSGAGTEHLPVPTRRHLIQHWGHDEGFFTDSRFPGRPPRTWSSGSPKY
ncbi:hypothetical protein [Allokutzneria oryzae]|uniref:Uncharacterized protein n=1 Tax=Allokutzneria oryzae TaxID=1378989 RepID=A0ABV6A3S7_9PSEU